MGNGATVRKRLASHFDNDDGREVADCKRMRQSPDAGAKLAARSCVTRVMHGSAGKMHEAVTGPARSNDATGIVKRGRGRPHKVS